MVERGRGARLLLEAAKAVGRGQRRRQDLERHCAIQPRVMRLVDLAHAAFANLLEHAVGPERSAGLHPGGL